MYPLTLNLSGIAELTDDELFRLCEANKELRIERNTQGELILMAPTGGESSRKNGNLFWQLETWNKAKGLGISLESSGGFRLPSGAMRAPDVAWIAKDRWDSLTAEQKKTFPPLCPDFVIELMSESDYLEPVQQKIEEWMENGCRLAWLINPNAEEVVIYRTNGEREVVEGFDKHVSGEGVLPGFMLDLNELQ